MEAAMSFSKSIALAALLALPVATFSAHAQEAPMPSPDSFRKGDRWEWRQVDTRTQLEEGKRTRTVEEVDGVLKFSENGRHIAVSFPYLGPPGVKKPWRVWPLRVGASWQYDEDWTRPDGVTGNTKADVAVTAYEEVSVPAGKFMAFKIELKGFYRNARGGHGQQKDTFWYAPSAAADVKLMRDDGHNMWTRELTSYTRGAP
jgi:hypothetical protein